MVAAMTEWGRTLQSYSPDQISLAIDTMKREYLKYPPSLPQFLQLVRGPTMAAHKAHKALPHLSRSEMKEEARGAIEVMRKILSSESPPPKRTDPGYIAWANYHRHVLGLRAIESVKPDGSFELI